MSLVLTIRSDQASVIFFYRLSELLEQNCMVICKFTCEPTVRSNQSWSLLSYVIKSEQFESLLCK